MIDGKGLELPDGFGSEERAQLEHVKANAEKILLMDNAKRLLEEGKPKDAWAELMDLRTLSEKAGDQAVVEECNRLLLAIVDVV